MKIKEPYKIISTGSGGNSIVIFNNILVDVGIPFSKIKDIQNQLQLITWSHKHKDHFNKATVKKLIFNRPGIRIAVCEHEVERARECGTKNIDIIEHGKWYDYGMFQISTFKTYHDVPSNGWRIKNDKYKLFIATDTSHLIGISAPNYTHYLCEANYDEETVYDIIQQHESRGEFSHQRGSINSHLSFQQCNDFYYKNKGEHSQLIRLHQSTTSL